MQKLILNGLHAGMEGVGQGIYAKRLIDGIRRHADFSSWSITLFVPLRMADALRARMEPMEVVGLKGPRIKHALLDSIAWHNLLLRHRRLREPGAIFFSPGPCWGLSAPPRIAITYHDCINRYYPVYMGRKGVRRWAAHRAERFLQRAHIVFTESEHAANDIESMLGVPKARLIAIPAWLPPEYNRATALESAPHVRTRYGLPARYWLYVGGYDIRKNVGCLIKAYALARQRVKCPPLVLAGRVPREHAPTHCDVIGALREANLPPEAVRQIGFVDAADMTGLYAGAELFIYPSMLEGYGLPPLESMGCGCPAIVADASSLKEVVRDPTYRFDPTNPEALAAILQRAAAAPLPLNPLFDRRIHDERAAIDRYLQHLAALGTCSE